jgi:hypothetical protein
MTSLPLNRTLTANGDYGFARADNQVPTGISAGRKALIEVDVHPDAGTFGGRTVTLGYQGESGNFVAYKDSAGTPIAGTAAFGAEVRVPISGILAVSVTGAGAAPKLIVSAIAAP